MIPNHFTIHDVDFSDAGHKNYYFSADLVDYAMKNGWYQPAVPGDFSDFDFARVYQDGPDKMHNLIRARQTWPMLLGERPEERASVLTQGAPQIQCGRTSSDPLQPL